MDAKNFGGCSPPTILSSGMDGKHFKETNLWAQARLALILVLALAIWAEMETASDWTPLAWAVLTLIVLQVGYFLLAFGLVSKRSTNGTDAKPEPVSRVQPLRRDGGVSSPGGR